jgi:hypothetical protein
VPHTSTNQKIHAVLTVAGAAGVVAMFLPFAWNVYPFKVVFDPPSAHGVWPCLVSFQFPSRLEQRDG